MERLEYVRKLGDRKMQIEHKSDVNNRENAELFFSERIRSRNRSAQVYKSL